MVCSVTALVALTFAEPTDPPERSEYVDLLERHDCWTDAPPADVAIPGHVIVTEPNGATRYVGRRMVHRALEHVFEDKHPRMAVPAFCR